jgi:hypothetical protein
MIEFSIGKKAKQPILDDKMSCSVKVVAGARNRHYLLFRAKGLPVVSPA